MFRRILTGALSTLIVVIICSSLLHAREERFYALLASFKNDVTVYRDAKTIPVKRGMFFEAQDRIVTGEDSYADIAFDGAKRNVIRIEENSELILKSVDPKTREFNLLEGSVLFRVKKLGRKSSFTIKTPISISGARGSGGRVERQGAKRDKIECHDDKIFAAGLDKGGNPIGEMTLAAGWKIFVNKFKKPEDLARLSGAERERWNRWREDFGKGSRRQRRIDEKTSDIESALDKFINKKEDFFESLDSKKIEDRAGSSDRGSCQDDSGSQHRLMD